MMGSTDRGIELIQRGSDKDFHSGKRRVWFPFNEFGIHAVVVCPMCGEYRFICAKQYTISKRGDVNPEFSCCDNPSICTWRASIRLAGYHKEQ